MFYQTKMNAFEIIRRDLELDSYNEDPIRNKLQGAAAVGTTYGRKYLSITVIQTCGQNRRDHPDAMKGENSVPEDLAKRAQRFTLPEDDGFLLGWAYHLFVALNKTKEQITTNDIETNPDVMGFLNYLTAEELKTDKDTVGVRENINLRLRMKAFLAKWTGGISANQIDRIIAAHRIKNYILLWNKIVIDMTR